MALHRFSPPAGLDEQPEAGKVAWSDRVASTFSEQADEFPQFFDPTVTDLAADHATRVVDWQAFPATVVAEHGPRSQELADGSRDLQDEYCEWSVDRDASGKLIAVTFTTETPDYYEHLFDTDPDVLLALYEQHLGHAVELRDLSDGDGSYRRRNRWNDSTDGPIIHLISPSNTLTAAIILAAQATVLRERDGQPVTVGSDLVFCGALGEPKRNSDPGIASEINALAATGADLTLADPPGLYLQRLPSVGIRAPDGADPADFWTIERGTPEFILRARFEVPKGRGYVAGDLKVGGHLLRFGGQIASRVRVRIAAIAQAGGHQPIAQPCVRS